MKSGYYSEMRDDPVPEILGCSYSRSRIGEGNGGMEMDDGFIDVVYDCEILRLELK